MDLEELIKASEAGLRLNIDLGTKLLLGLEGYADSLKTYLVGMEQDQYLIVSTPKVAGIRNQLFTGKTVNVRYLSAGSIFGFQSKLLGQVKIPYPLIFLSYPTVVSRHDLRRRPRVDCHIPGTLRMGLEKHPMVVLDISQGGCQAVVRRGLPKLSVKGEVLISLFMSELSEIKDVPALVRNKRQDTQRTFLGLEFSQISPEQDSSLQTFIDTLLDLTT